MEGLRGWREGIFKGNTPAEKGRCLHSRVNLGKYAGRQRHSGVDFSENLAQRTRNWGLFGGGSPRVRRASGKTGGCCASISPVSVLYKGDNLVAGKSFPEGPGKAFAMGRFGGQNGHVRHFRADSRGKRPASERELEEDWSRVTKKDDRPESGVARHGPSRGACRASG